MLSQQAESLTPKSYTMLRVPQIRVPFRDLQSISLNHDPKSQTRFGLGVSHVLGKYMIDKAHEIFGKIYVSTGAPPACRGSPYSQADASDLQGEPRVAFLNPTPCWLEGYRGHGVECRAFGLGFVGFRVT